jgi:hypothetical protein
MATGEKLYCEQISHHPPITAFLLEGPDGIYQMSGYHTLKAWLNGMQSIGGSKLGKCELKFADGGHYTFEHPEMSIEGIMKTSKV